MIGVNCATPQNWTIAALECLDRNCKCEGCYYYEEFFKDKQSPKNICKMKDAVLFLKNIYGVPDKNSRIKILNNQENIKYRRHFQKIKFTCLDTGETFKDIKALAKHLGASSKQLVNFFERKVVTIDNKVYIKEIQEIKRTSPHSRKRVACLETGEEYKSIKELATTLKMRYDTVALRIRKGKAINGKHYIKQLKYQESEENQK